MAEFYNTILPGRIDRYRETLDSVPFHQVYFGGGTPTIADAETLEGIYRQIPNFRDIPFKASEASPYTVTPEHLELFRDYRFTYVSFGVQTLSTRILNAQNRLVVGKEKLIRICRQLNEYGIVSNIDLIFYLDTGTLDDLEQTKRDLTEVMSEIRPVSITLHSNYMVEKSLEKQSAMMRVIREMLDRCPDYRCVNALLDDDDTEFDMKQAAEYRLMRGSREMNFYMLNKIPQSHAFGHNMLAIGEYGDFKPRYNYFYVYDFMDKYTFKSMLKKYKEIRLDFGKIREQLNLPAGAYVGEADFFKEDRGRERFKQVLKDARLPYYNFK
jgi:coproporphyrinogen III oxidase-like Fe-S oxidoreductase